MEEIKRMEVGGQVDSDHHPVVAWIRGGGEEGGCRSVGEGRGRGGRGCWDETRREQFKRGMGRLGLGEGDVQGKIDEMNKKIREVMEKTEEEEKERVRRRRGWWDEECRERKREVRRVLETLRAENGGEGKV